MVWLFKRLFICMAEAFQLLFTVGGLFLKRKRHGLSLGIKQSGPLFRYFCCLFVDG